MTRDEAPPSKSQVKREMKALRDLGARITELSADQRAELPLSTALHAALAEFDRLRAREARRRHLSFIGKLMREEDLDAVRAGLDRLDAASAVHARELHALEAWRDALIADDGRLADFLDRYPHADRPRIRQLIRACREEAARGAGGRGEDRRHYREMFRCLRETVALEGETPEPPP